MTLFQCIIIACDILFNLYYYYLQCHHHHRHTHTYFMAVWLPIDTLYLIVFRKIECSSFSFIMCRCFCCKIEERYIDVLCRRMSGIEESRGGFHKRTCYLKSLKMRFYLILMHFCQQTSIKKYIIFEIIPPLWSLYLFFNFFTFFAPLLRGVTRHFIILNQRFSHGTWYSIISEFKARA